MKPKYNLGIDIGGTKCAAVLGRCAQALKPSENGSLKADELIVDKLMFKTDTAKGWRENIRALTEASSILLERNGAALNAIGISCGGPLDSQRGMILSPPNLPGWDHVPVCEIFETAFHAPVVLQNDADACAVAEWKYGAGKGMKSLVFLTFGTGMGAGLILDGKLYSGAHGLAGEVGHIRLSEDGPKGYGKNGSFEGYCSGNGIVRLAECIAAKDGISLPEGTDARQLARAAEASDSFACRVYKESAEKLGRGLALIIDMLDPEAIIIGSIYHRSRPLFEKTALSVIEAEALEGAAARCKILPSALGDKIGDIAALSLCETIREKGEE